MREVKEEDGMCALEAWTISSAVVVRLTLLLSLFFIVYDDEIQFYI